MTRSRRSLFSVIVICFTHLFMTAQVFLSAALRFIPRVIVHYLTHRFSLTLHDFGLCIINHDISSFLSVKQVERSLIDLDCKLYSCPCMSVCNTLIIIDIDGPETWAKQLSNT